MIVLGEGGNVLSARPDALSVHKTHSMPWLAQFVSQIIMALKWEHEFKCDGIENVADFKAVMESINAADPGAYVFRDPTRHAGQDSATVDHVSAVREFARRMDALIELLAATADGLAAEWVCGRVGRSMMTRRAAMDLGRGFSEGSERLGEAGHRQGKDGRALRFRFLGGEIERLSVRLDL